MKGAILSGVLAKIYEQVCELVEETYHEIKTEVENSYHQYYESYRERHGQVKVYRVGMREPIPLDHVYVGVQFLNQHTVSWHSSSEGVEQAFRYRNSEPFDLTSDERQDGIQVANSKQYLMLLGEAGVGKSTFLRKVGLEALKGKNGNFEHECIPVFLELKRFTEAQIDIETLIVSEFEICGFPHPEELTNTALKAGNLLVLFDGLDEVPAANIDNIIDKIGDFVDRYRQNRFVASCRIAAYKGGFRRFTEVEMADFDDSQIEAYIENWFKSTPDPNLQRLDEQMKTAEQCWTLLNSSEHSATKELARNPLLLTLVCMVYDKSQNFQRNRARFCEEALTIFLREWLAQKGVRRDEPISQYLDIADEKRMLSEIAAKNFEASRFLFSEDELITQIQEFGESNANTLKTFNASKILNTILIDQGLFVERVPGFYSFSHLTFQEYLTANYIIRHPQSIQGLVTRRLHFGQWREIFLLTAGLMREADDLLEAMEAEAAKLINTPKLKALFQWTERITDTSNDRYTGIAKRSFALSQYFSLQLLNEMYEMVEDSDNYDLLNQDMYQYPYRFWYVCRDRTLYLYRDRTPDLDRDLYRAPDLDRDLYVDLYRHWIPHRDLDPDLYLYLCLYLYFDQYRYRYRDLGFYQDFYRYMDAKLYPLVFGGFGHRFDEELRERVTFIKRMEEMKIFKGVDLQQMIRRFNEQREFIGMAGRGEFVEPPMKSIHDTWLSVLGITYEMLAISNEELNRCCLYLRAVDLIVACKEAAGRASPDVWQEIEDRLLAWDSEEPED